MDYKYVIVGGGMAAASAVEGIREKDTDGKIGLFSKETNPPYNRPPLSKGLWVEGSTEVEDIWRQTEMIENLDLHLEKTITRIDREKQTVFDEEGEGYGYERLLLATGGAPKTLPFDPEGKNILYFRTLEDFNELYSNMEMMQKFGVIGAGFIGAEITAALKTNNKDVVLIFPEKKIGGKRYPEQIATLITDEYISRGVDVLPEEVVTDVERTGDRFTIHTKSGKVISVDKVVAGIGIVPNLKLAMDAGLETDEGIIVDKTLRTSDIQIWAAGDVATFYSPHLKERIRIEHAENAKQMGKIAGLNMAGESIPYNYLPLFYSDMFDMGYEAVGKLNPELKIIIDWKKKPEKGIVYYLDEKQGKVRGVILWNVWGKADEARELIASEDQLKPVDLVDRI